MVICLGADAHTLQEKTITSRVAILILIEKYRLQTYTICLFQAIVHLKTYIIGHLQTINLFIEKYHLTRFPHRL